MTVTGTVVVCLGDLVEDVVVRPAGPLREGTDTVAWVERRRGGSAANVAVAVVAAGTRARFVGRVGADPLGDRLVTELEEAGVEVCVQRRGRTGSIVAVLDSSGERSFYTDRGAADALDRLPRGWAADMGALHLPLYSFDGEPLASTARRAIAARSQALVSVDLSSVAVIERLGPDLVDGLGADIVFANEAEAALIDLPLTGGAPTGAPLAVVKRGAQPTRLYRGDAVTEVADSRKVGAVLDTVGAGDAFAAGFLVARLAGRNDSACARAAHRAAVTHLRRLTARHATR